MLVAIFGVDVNSCKSWTLVFIAASLRNFDISSIGNSRGLIFWRLTFFNSHIPQVVNHCYHLFLRHEYGEERSSYSGRPGLEWRPKTPFTPQARASTDRGKGYCAYPGHGGHRPHTWRGTLRDMFEHPFARRGIYRMSICILCLLFREFIYPHNFMLLIFSLGHLRGMHPQWRVKWGPRTQIDSSHKCLLSQKNTTSRPANKRHLRFMGWIALFVLNQQASRMMASEQFVVSAFGIRGTFLAHKIRSHFLSPVFEYLDATLSSPNLSFVQKVSEMAEVSSLSDPTAWNYIHNRICFVIRCNTEPFDL
jgi:hypothetical protein